MENKKWCPFCGEKMICEDLNYLEEGIYRYGCYSCHFRIEIADLGFVSEEKKALLDNFVEKSLDNYKGEL